MSKIYVPLDLETTGLDPEEDAILEIAWGILDENFKVIVEPKSFIVDHHHHGWADVWNRLRNAPDVVRKMHSDSGLVGSMISIAGMDLGKIADELHGDIRIAKSGLDANTTAHLLGMSVGFDRSFLEAQIAFEGTFDDKAYHGIHHRLLDLSSIKLMYASAGLDLPEVVNDNPHRALSDVWEAIHIAQALRADLVFNHKTAVKAA